MSDLDFPHNEQHLPHEAWHVVQQKVRRVNVPEGAQFFAYISPKNNTEENVTEWSITVSQGNWSGQITSQDPDEIIQSPGLSGEFEVEVRGAGPRMSTRQLKNDSSQSGPNVMCSINCTAMILIYSTNEEGTDAMYYTTADAFCE